MLKSFESEKSLIWAILMESNMLELAINSKITENSFSDEFHRKAFSEMVRMSKAGKSIDLAGLLDAMPCDAERILDAATYGTTTAHIESWIQNLKEAEAARTIYSASANTARSLKDKERSQSLAEIAGELQDATEAARNMLNGQSVRSLRELEVSFVENLSHEAGKAIPYFPERSEATKSMLQHKRELFVLCADAGAGKTALAVQAALEQVKSGLRVAYFCTESSSEAILARFAGALSGIAHYRIRQPGVSRQTIDHFSDVMHSITEDFHDKLFIIGSESGVNTPESIISEVKRIISTHGGLDVAIVDFIQFLQVPSMQKVSRFEQMNHAISYLHSNFQKLNIAGIVLSQLNRDGQKSKEVPGLHSIKDSSLIGQIADEVLFLCREKAKEPGQKDRTFIYNAKGRNAPKFFHELQFDGVCYVSPRRFTKADIPA